MEVSSVKYIIFIGIVMTVYFILPKRMQWIELLVASVIFYIFNAPMYTIVYVIVSLIIVFGATNYFSNMHSERNKKIVLACSLIAMVGMLYIFKYVNLSFQLINIISKRNVIEKVSIVAPLAISFYMLQMISYLLDSYWGIVTPEKNIFKLALYNIYFPQMVSGPISRYNDLANQFFEEHRFDYGRVVNGLKRIAWGLMKKLLIASKIGLLVDAIYNHYEAYSGVYIWFAMFAFMIQLYADFSGCMDIVIGVSNCLDIHIAENFNAPFLSRTVQEFWQRWHITLGQWLRDYIMNPLLKSDPFISIGKKAKNIFGKKRGKKIPSYIAMFFVWTAMGIWHGDDIKYIVGEGWWFWLILVFEDIIFDSIKPISKALKSHRYINYCLEVLLVIKTFVLVSIGNVFFRAETIQKAMDMLLSAFQKATTLDFVSCLLSNGFPVQDVGGVTGIVLLCFNCILLLIYEFVKYSGMEPLQVLHRRPKVVRWIVYWDLTLTVMMTIFGSVRTFIYAGF